MSSDEPRVWVQTIMGTVVSVHAYGTTAFVKDAETAASVARAFNELREADMARSPSTQHRNHSLIARVV